MRASLCSSLAFALALAPATALAQQPAPEASGPASPPPALTEPAPVVPATEPAPVVPATEPAPPTSRRTNPATPPVLNPGEPQPRGPAGAPGMSRGYAPSAPGSGTPNAPSPPARPPTPTGQPPVRAAEQPSGFSFGSYGRVVAASDLRGRRGREANIVAHGTRIDEQTYAELQFHRDDNFGPVHTQIVATLALAGPLFHESGRFDARLAVRNLYIEARNILTPGLALWVGSRMYRGDDVYLLNWWPLDNLNTVGAGARYDIGEAATLYAHVGTNRLDTPYQFQQIRVVPREGFFAPTVLLLDRPRAIGSLKATWWLMGRTARAGVKLSLYGEAHALPEGVRQNPENNRFELLPSDSGYVLGAQIGAYTGVRNTFVNLFFRYAQGLGAYGDLSVPFTVTAMQTSARARDVVLALSANWEYSMFGVLAGAYARYFQDADAALYGRNGLVEGTVVLRPMVWLGERAGLAVEGSYQAVQYNTLDPVTGQGAMGGSLWRFAVMPFLTPAGRGSYTRPHLRLIYAATLRDEGARRLYAPDDPFGFNTVEHFLGVNCEWWFNSSYL